MHEKDAFQAFCRLRWPTTGGIPVCPSCGSLEHYQLGKGRQGQTFKCACAACRRQYTPTTGTALQYRKASYCTLLAAIAVSRAHPEISAVEWAARVGVTQKAAYHLRQKVWTFIGASHHYGAGARAA